MNTFIILLSVIISIFTANARTPSRLLMAKGGKSACATVDLSSCPDVCTGQCAEDEECMTKDTMVQGCSGCPEFFKCKPNPGGNGKDGDEQQICPQVACITPCPAGQCGDDEECVTKDTTIPGTGGCPGCPVFQRCKSDNGNNGNGVTPCGKVKCRGSTPVCCNASCGICRASGESCDDVECETWANEP